MAEGMTVIELAEVVGMTPRNVRAYQSRGLLYPPVISGRVAHYSAAHVARLHLIASLQREGFTLAAIKRIVDRPDSYGAIVADRRRRFRDGSSDIVATVPVPEETIREAVPGLPDDLTETGLFWRDEDGQLVSHTLLVGVGRMLAAQGMSEQVLANLQLDAAKLGRRIGAMLREHLIELVDDAVRRADLARVAVQLSATAYEIAFLEAATADGENVATRTPG
ncbi:MAG TPA: helix-turn-helix domain-containing protein [Actinomycetes bacterium]|jgi:DNA-binding transcriptional MerR regulator|nr:helix-turn-helix domain-containing protein [Actinomycetes bacterium]